MTDEGHVETDPALDPDGLREWLKVKLPDYSGGFSIARLGEGQSCLTYLLTGDGWDLVLRRPPRGDLPPTAFDVRREYRVMTALREAEAPVPVPRTVALCEDLSAIGSNFYLMETVPGLVVRNELPEDLSSIQ